MTADPLAVCQTPVPIRDHSGGLAIITSGYRTPTRPGHAAIDVGSTDGIEIGVDLFPPEPCEVIRLGVDPGVGAGQNLWLLGMLTGLGHKYFHTAWGDFLVKVGDELDYDDQVADVGNSGTGAAHLHWQVHDLRRLSPYIWGNWGDHTTIDPAPIWRAAVAAGRWPRLWRPGSTPTPTPIDPTEEFTVAQFDEIKAQLDRIEQRQAQFENDTRVITKFLVEQEGGEVLQSILFHLDPRGDLDAADGIDQDEATPMRDLVERIDRRTGSLAPSVA